MDNIEKFKRSIFYRRLGFSLFIIAIFPAAFIRNKIMGYCIAAVLIVIAIFFERKYRCPVCGYRFDPRISSSELTYCSNCSSKLQ
jgi:cell division protein FtsW (lipid II flippase)